MLSEKIENRLRLGHLCRKIQQTDCIGAMLCFIAKLQTKPQYSSCAKIVLTSFVINFAVVSSSDS